MHRSPAVEITGRYTLHQNIILRIILAVVAALCLLFIASEAAGAADKSVYVTLTTDLSSKTVRTDESNLANIVADAIRAADKADISFIPASAFQDVTISKGTRTSEDILKALMYPDDNIVIVKLTGLQIHTALEQSLALSPQKNSAFLQVSGMTINIDPSAERGKRISTIKIGKSPVINDKNYLVAMPSPLANGALAYFKVWSKKDIDHETEKSLEQAVIDYLTTQKSIAGKSEDRLVFKK